ncbi:SDR family oxidoreductase [Leucobacter weissii]|uniref:SDR family oxidoreductase n=1 Tax=Leucobacter weissii TaxID=1983706 RepID=A0A939MLF7_9MICO|nr:SDR family oxidoreductase [Leucobacter weissii]MBO1902085.1 SDR family oxidoreductase [Leucobacter weissii]
MPNANETILVTGASGHLGGLIVRALLERGASSGDLVAGARDTSRLADLAGLGVRTARVDYEDPASLSRALDGVGTVVLVSSSEVGKRAQQHDNVIAAAKDANVGRILYTSLAAATTSRSPLAPEHIATEEALAASGLPFTILRNNWYTENYADAANQARESGELVAGAGRGLVASASRRDYAEGAAVAALEAGHLGKIYEFAGDTAWDYARLAEAIGEVVGRDVAYRAISAEEQVELLTGIGLDAGTAGFVAAIDAGIAQGDLSRTDGTLSRLIGRPTTPLVDGLRAALDD